MIARVNTDFEWVCPSKGGANCVKAKEPVSRANLFDASHWVSPVGLDGQPGARSGVSTKPSTVRQFMGSGAFDLRFSFYDSSASISPRDDAYATFSSPGNMFSDAGTVIAAKNKLYKWKVIKQGSSGKKFSGSTICWIPAPRATSVRGYEPGLFMGVG